ncbi:MAG: HD domain-containing protein [Treponema sp.]|jgi:exopolyphosphatase/guanosine-5'-triphosphate,3'-diphosphate pyrophosphatase|nr:HD domain-containing protein [Treponema sp.]
MISSNAQAVLEIGSTGIRLLVAEIDGSGQWRTLDEADRPVTLGRDVFTTGQVSRESFLECLSVLKNFREMLAGWGVAGADVHVIATSALRAARNREVFADRVKLDTGCDLAIVEGIEENRLIYLAVRFALKNDMASFWRGNSIIFEIGGGSTEIMLLRRGKMVAAHSLRLGTILIDTQSRRARGGQGAFERYLNENISSTAGRLSQELDLAAVRTLVLAGSDARIAADNAGADLNEHCKIMTRGQFLQFAERIQEYSIEDCIARFNIRFAEAEFLNAGVQVYRLLLEKTCAQDIIVPRISIREGLLVDLARGVDPQLQEEFYSQVSAGALHLGRKYHFDEAHHRHVAALCMVLFDALAREHGLGRRERMLLEVAASLHDIGMFIRGSGHHLHGQYIVTNAEIFGLHKEELDLVGNVIRYHRGPLPSPADIDYIALQKEERIIVLKLASLLRVSDALDRGHSQQIKTISVERREGSIVLHGPAGLDLSLERVALEEKAGLFQEVFGYKVLLF